MTTAPATHDDALVLDYLAALWAASGDLPPETRDDLMSTVSGYIAMRRDLAGDPSLALGRLGPPDQLVAAVRRSGTPTHLRLPVPPPAGPPVPGAGGSERVAVALLIAGAFVLPLIGQAAAMLIATVSPRWSPVQKAAAWLLVAAPVVAALFLLVALAGVPLLSSVTFLGVHLAACAGAVCAGLTLRHAHRPA